MKRVVFAGGGDIELTLEADFAESTNESPAGQVRVQVEGIDVDNFDDDAPAVKAYGWYSPEEAREIARYFNEMADRAEAGA